MEEKMKIGVFKLNWIEQRNLDFGDSTRKKDRQLSTGGCGGRSRIHGYANRSVVIDSRWLSLSTEGPTESWG